MSDFYLENVIKEFGDLRVLDDISIKFQEEKITCILGPSGCGKSTLLNIISGIDKDYQGNVVGFDEKEISFVFQEDRLIPWLKTKDNIEIVLKKKYKIEERKELIYKYTSMMGIDKYLNFYPNELSGGMKQRVSLARALSYGGEIIIMDEPFKTIDVKNKNKLIKDFKTIQNEEKKTVIFVTHDIDECLELGDEIYILTDKPTKIKRKVNSNISKKEILEIVEMD
ncbi:ABC transporter ATP-binding protein [Clostridium sp. 'White wine YQ']|uniref:ABC transporter ATP-binding protein n=1 Tax=Clostridium sp. 'White wine YQ' TaxID=3027474 RepID=UPI002365C68B|nr:ABC transporter ATP-binding protein [Clostridium sp. 'White wine YQ']MDD7795834.1 ABC transporter ATP-binding protein [Clostridium sp. 'White wine YQ']